MAQFDMDDPPWRWNASVFAEEARRGNRRVIALTHFWLNLVCLLAMPTFTESLAPFDSHPMSQPVPGAISFPDGKLCDVTQPPYNAKGDNRTVDTAAIQRAVDACGDLPTGACVRACVCARALAPPLRFSRLKGKVARNEGRVSNCKQLFTDAVPLLCLAHQVERCCSRRAVGL